MIPATFKNHILSHIGRGIIPYHLGRVNASVCAIIVVETYFRCILLRLLEIIIWIVTRNNSMTIGLAQVRATTWNEIGDFKDKRLYFKICMLVNYRANYDFVLKSLELNNIDMLNPEDVVAFHNGEHYRKSYLGLYKFSVDTINEYLREGKISLNGTCKYF